MFKLKRIWHFSTPKTTGILKFVKRFVYNLLLDGQVVIIFKPHLLTMISQGESKGDTRGVIFAVQDGYYGSHLESNLHMLPNSKPN